MRLLPVAMLLVAVVHISQGEWDDKFRSSKCYEYGLDNLNDRMPLNMGNLVALIEKVERQHSYTNPDRVAEALVNRYRLDGITFRSQVTTGFWSANELPEVEKQDIVTLITQIEEIVPRDSYDPREECSLHFMLSHSTDLYPHVGMNLPWEEGNYRRRRSEHTSVYPPGPDASVRVALPNGIDPSIHPLENGVIRTHYGPVAAGTLLAGIMVNDQSQNSIRILLGETSSEYMPEEMQAKTLSPIHAATLSGDIGQSAVLGAITSTTNNGNFLGPRGMFGNTTAAPKTFTLEDNNGGVPVYLTRAEVFAGIDAMLIQKVLRSSSSSSRVRLSDLLRMYYSDHGLPGYPQYRACNRMEAMKDLDSSKIEEQALNFMYIYADKFPELRRIITENQDNFIEIENTFKNALKKAWDDFSSFVGSYTYEDYDSCPIMESKEVPCENLVDLLMVYSGDNGVTEMEKQRKYLTHLTQMVEVGEERSRVGVMSGKTGQWLYPMTNFSNVADWGSNFTTDESSTYGSSSSDMPAVLIELANYYTTFYNELRSDLSNASANSQVVLWNVPGSIPDPEIFLEDLKMFNTSFPDVYFLLVGRTKGPFIDMLVDYENDFFVNNVQDQEEFAETLNKRICQVPSLFIYPACDTLNYTNYGEASHVYEGFVSPNYTTYVKIAPQNFRFSGHLKLLLTEGDVKVCTSRESPLVDSAEADYQCMERSGELEFWYLCGRWLDQCLPIYISVTGTAINNVFCDDYRCQYPNQIVYNMKHEDMTCGSRGGVASLLLVAAMALIHAMRQ